MTEGTALVKVSDVKELGQVFVKSGFFQDSKDEAQAIVKIMAGIEVGIQPITAMTGIHIVKGKVTLGANIMAAAVKNHPKYNYRVTKHDAKECTIVFYEGKEKIGISTFTMEEARQAGLINNPSWQKWPKNMLFARALSNGVRWYCPDAFGHAPVYVPEEMGLDVNEDGEAINATPSKPAKGSYDNVGTDHAYDPPEDEIQEAEYADVDEETEAIQEIEEELEEDLPSEHDPLDGPEFLFPDLVDDDMDIRDAYELITSKAFDKQMLPEVKEVVMEVWPEYEPAEMFPYHIPPKELSEIIEKLTGVKLKYTERLSTCKADGCDNKITAPEKEEQGNLCRKCFAEA